MNLAESNNLNTQVWYWPTKLNWKESDNKDFIGKQMFLLSHKGTGVTIPVEGNKDTIVYYTITSYYIGTEQKYGH